MGHRRDRNVNVSQGRATPPGHATINGIMTILLTDAAFSVFGTVTEGVTKLVTVETNNIRTRSGNMIWQMTLTAGGNLTFVNRAIIAKTMRKGLPRK